MPGLLKFMLDKEKIEHIFDQLKTVQNSLISSDQKKDGLCIFFPFDFAV